MELDKRLQDIAEGDRPRQSKKVITWLALGIAVYLCATGFIFLLHVPLSIPVNRVSDSTPKFLVSKEHAPMISVKQAYVLQDPQGHLISTGLPSVFYFDGSRDIWVLEFDLAALAQPPAGETQWRLILAKPSVYQLLFGKKQTVIMGNL